jgi:hypothetical protein
MHAGNGPKESVLRSFSYEARVPNPFVCLRKQHTRTRCCSGAGSDSSFIQSPADIARARRWYPACPCPCAQLYGGETPAGGILHPGTAMLAPRPAGPPAPGPYPTQLMSAAPLQAAPPQFVLVSDIELTCTGWGGDPRLPYFLTVLPPVAAGPGRGMHYISKHHHVWSRHRSLDRCELLLRCCDGLLRMSQGSPSR